MRQGISIFSGIILLFLLSGCNSEESREFFLDWSFHLGDVQGAYETEFDDSGWQRISIPHDWSIEQAFTTENTASSTGFLPGGIGWYRKSFTLDEDPAGKHIRVEFDGIYNNSTVWINGYELGTRPYGYSSFSYDLTDHVLAKGEENVLAVRVDHSAYADSRWYTGSGIYRDARLVITDEVHIPQWGVRITTPDISSDRAKVRLECSMNQGSRSGESIDVEVKIFDQQGVEVQGWIKEMMLEENTMAIAEVEIPDPELWSLDHPHLYSAEVILSRDKKVLDRFRADFGIRSIRFDADKGFFLNDEPVKIKGVNLHHDAGCLGAAVPKDVWRMRIEGLQSVGCNAIRMSHNPHDPNLMDLCDEMGMLVMAEAFDEWSVPKDKSVNWLSDNAASPESSRSYPEVFPEWAERDLKDLVRRDFNHPSVIMWSIGNEIEWTFPYYPQSSTYEIGNLDEEYFSESPSYNRELILEKMKGIHPGPDTLLMIAQQLSTWVKEIDDTRYITSGNVHPSVGLATGYHAALDVSGFNYRASEYDAAHAAYPNLKILGSENWVTWPEWKAVAEREFVAGIFLWTGFAYMGEAGPWPRKGLNISLFDFAGYKSPRGHLFESLWKEDPKVYMVTTPEEESEFSFSKEEGWTYTEREYAIPQMTWLRRWEWYDVYEKWNYDEGDAIIVQAYTNCEEAELILNGESLGRKQLADFEDRMLKWLVPYEKGKLEIVGYKQGAEADRYVLQTEGKLSQVALKLSRTEIKANYRDVLLVEALLLDESGNPVRDQDAGIQFTLEGPARILGIDNGSEYNVEDTKSDRVTTYNGRAYLFVQSMGEAGTLSVSASVSGIHSDEASIKIKQ